MVILHTIVCARQGRYNVTFLKYLARYSTVLIYNAKYLHSHSKTYQKQNKAIRVPIYANVCCEHAIFRQKDLRIIQTFIAMRKCRNV